MRFVSFRGATVFLALLFLLVAWQSRSLSAQRRDSLPEAYSGYSADAPPALNFVIAGLGGFRGIVAEVLWFRASRLQDEGRYMELVLLADWITMLDPHAAEAWAYNAWNLAYNVSIMMARHEDRLRWVQSGIKLLRDEGLRYNPREPRLYRELAWLYQNKVGDNLDGAHLTYKFALAETMAPFVRADGTVNVTPENRKALAVLRLDADRMVTLEKRFGPLDWRLAETHAVYWADCGVEFSSGTERLLCRRGVYQPLMKCVFHGKFTGASEKRLWKTEGNPALMITTADYMIDTLNENPSWNMAHVVLRFISVALQTAEQEGKHECARALYDRLLRTLPTTVSKPTLDEVIKGWEPPDETR